MRWMHPNPRKRYGMEMARFMIYLTGMCDAHRVLYVPTRTSTARFVFNRQEVVHAVPAAIACMARTDGRGRGGRLLAVAGCWVLGGLCRLQREAEKYSTHARTLQS